MSNKNVFSAKHFSRHPGIPCKVGQLYNSITQDSGDRWAKDYSILSKDRDDFNDSQINTLGCLVTAYRLLLTPYSLPVISH
jgi:hypothetical protein